MLLQQVQGEREIGEAGRERLCGGSGGASPHLFRHFSAEGALLAPCNASIYFISSNFPPVAGAGLEAAAAAAAAVAAAITAADAAAAAACLPCAFSPLAWLSNNPPTYSSLATKSVTRLGRSRVPAPAPISLRRPSLPVRALWA